MTELSKVSPLQAALTSGGIAAVSNLLPIIGPTVQAMFDGTIDTRWKNRAIDTYKNLDQRVAALENASTEFLTSDEFQDLFAETLAAAVRLADDTTRKLYASTIVAAAADGPGSQIAARRVIARLERLSPAHFRFLKAMAHLAETNTEHFRSINSFVQMVHTHTQIESHNAAMDADRLFDDLRQEGLIHADNRTLDRNSRQISMSRFDASESKAWLTWQAHECLHYLWPEQFS